jgi:hypothetical protein
MTMPTSTDLAVRLLRYAWAAPATAVGCCLALVAFCFGATYRIVNGVIEIAGGRFDAYSLQRLLPRALRFDAITFGHVVLGKNHYILETHRSHEHVHVRQYERWGLLFFPLYIGSSLVQLLRGRNAHCYNQFEREANAAVHDS